MNQSGCCKHVSKAFGTSIANPCQHGVPTCQVSTSTRSNISFVPLNAKQPAGKNYQKTFWKPTNAWAFQKLNVSVLSLVLLHSTNLKWSITKSTMSWNARA